MAMRRDEQKRAERAKREQQFKEVEDSLARAAGLIDASKREIRRSRQIMQDSDAAQDKADKERDDADRT